MKINKILLVIILAVCLPVSTFSQIPTFEFLYPEVGNNASGYKVELTPDGGFLIGGTIFQYIANNDYRNRLVVLKINAGGKTEFYEIIDH